MNRNQSINNITYCIYSSGNYGCSQQYYNYAAAENGVLFTVGDKCLELVPTHHSWLTAQSDCVQRGGNLVTVDSAAKQSAIYQVNIKAKLCFKIRKINSY